MAVKKIDVHTHLYPRSYMDILEKYCESPQFIKLSEGAYRMQEGNTVMGHIDKLEEIDPDLRAAVIPKLGLDGQIISTPLPGAERFAKPLTVEVQELINNELAAACKKHPDVMPGFLCSLSWKDVDASLKEMKRAQGMGALGILMPSNIHGRSVSDPEFEPIFKQAEELNFPLLVHPTVPLTGDAQNINGLPWQLFGFTHDTSSATVGCLFKGYLEKYPKLKFIVTHTGGFIPFLTFRIANSYKKYAETYKGANEWVKTDKSFVEYLQKIMFDNCSWWEPSFKCAYELTGIDGLCLGTDYPHRAGGDWQAASFLEKIEWLDADDKDAIYSGNLIREMPGLKSKI